MKIIEKQSSIQVAQAPIRQEDCVQLLIGKNR